MSSQILKWFIELPKLLADFGVWLFEPLKDFNGEVFSFFGITFTPISIFAVGTLSIIIIAKVIALAIPG